MAAGRLGPVARDVRTTASAAEFAGFPVAALDFYDDLEMDNTKSFWEAHKRSTTTSVKAPMTALTPRWSRSSAQAKVFRPYRDVRFAKDKTPYKTHQGAYVPPGRRPAGTSRSCRPGVRVGVGFYEASSPRLAAIRAAVADDRPAPSSQDPAPASRRTGWELGGERLKTSPRGYDADHPRIDLLRHKSMTLGTVLRLRADDPHAGAARPGAKDWRAARPFVEWIAANAGSSGCP